MIAKNRPLFASYRAAPAESGRRISPRDNCVSENFYDELKPRLHTRIGKAVHSAARVVDLGCGNCELALFLAKSNHQEVIGVDISDTSFPAQRWVQGEKSETVRCVKKDARALTFLRDSSVDAAVSVWALHEMASPIAVLCEARRILRPGGQMLVVDFPRDSLAQRLWNEDYYAPEEVADMLREAGFEAAQCEVIAHGHIIWARAEVQLPASCLAPAKLQERT
jgi:SAM-dependent methyltransferase